MLSSLLQTLYDIKRNSTIRAVLHVFALSALIFLSFSFPGKFWHSIMHPIFEAPKAFYIFKVCFAVLLLVCSFGFVRGEATSIILAPPVANAFFSLTIDVLKILMRTQQSPDATVPFLVLSFAALALWSKSYTFARIILYFSIVFSSISLVLLQWLGAQGVF